ncbi:MAG: hypothetical protein B6229_08470 [Spirochaetaceae bacterium 4572_7]|nr:MAG: hypothetical protein B6229_08470 [Spirochaetaceae bacterium 4572_7]
MENVLYAMKILFLIISLVLTTSHSIFFLRAYILRHKNFRPKEIDINSRNTSMILLPFYSILGSIISINIIFTVILWLPIILIIISHFFRDYANTHPYLLPFTNMLLFISATVLFIIRLTGFTWV